MNPQKIKVMNRCCPICESEEIEILSKGIRNDKNKYVLKCKNCETGFLENIKSEEDLEEYYKEKYRKEFTPNINEQTNAKELFETYSPFQDERLKNLAPYMGKEKRLMEIGSSAGMFLYHVKDKFKEVVGVELDRDSAYFSKKICNCEVYQKPLKDLTFVEPESFDVICAFQVLEHVSNPREFIQQALRFLKKDGVLYFEFPNRFDALVSSYKLPYHSKFFYHSAHNYYFSEKGIRLVLEKLNLDFEFVYSQDYNIINHINWINNDRPQKDCIPGLSIPNISYQENAGRDIMNKLSDFFISMDRKYKSLLQELKISSNFAFIAKKG